MIESNIYYIAAIAFLYMTISGGQSVGLLVVVLLTTILVINVAKI